MYLSYVPFGCFWSSRAYSQGFEKGGKIGYLKIYFTDISGKSKKKRRKKLDLGKFARKKGEKMRFWMKAVKKVNPFLKEGVAALHICREYQIAEIFVALHIQII